MKIITDIKESNELLLVYSGADAKIAFYTESLKKIAIRIKHRDIQEVIYIIGGSCDYIKGHFSFSDAHVLIIMEKDEETNECITTIMDENAGFELITLDGFVLAQGQESEFGTSFQDFIKDKS